MQVSGGKVDALAGRQADPVQQHRSEHACITRVALPQLQGRLGLGGEFRCPRTKVVDGAVERRGHQDVERGLRRGDPRGEQRAQPVGVGLPGQQSDERVEIRDGERLQERDAAVDRTEAGQRLERTERDDQFGLVAAVAVVARRRRHRNAELVLAGEALPRLLCARVRLQRQRFVGRQHLGEERQRVAEPLAGGRPSWPSGSALMASSSDRSPWSVSSWAGSPGCAPSHSSASGCAVGLGLPVNSAMAVCEPHA